MDIENTLETNGGEEMDTEEAPDDSKMCPEGRAATRSLIIACISFATALTLSNNPFLKSDNLEESSIKPTATVPQDFLDDTVPATELKIDHINK